jgi:hypothetical protein
MRIILFFCCFWATTTYVAAQGVLEAIGDVDTLPPFQIGALPYDYDTLAAVYYGSFTIQGKIRTEDEEKRIRRLKQNVLKVYPYSQRAIAVLREIDEVSSSLDKKRDKKKYLHQLEDEMREEFEKELKKMYRSDGRVLIKIIERETGKPFYTIIKELKNPITAMAFQMVAKRYGYDLKQGYNSTEEKELEAILLQVETLGLQSIDPKAKIDTTAIYNSSQAAKNILEKKQKKNK